MLQLVNSMAILGITFKITVKLGVARYVTAMATRGMQKPTISTITTTEIKEELVRKNGDNTELFYIYVSTSGLDPSPPQAPSQQILSTSDSGGVAEQMEIDNQQEAQTTTQAPCDESQQHSEDKKKNRRNAMRYVHDFVLPSVLCRDGWRKVVDKDGTTTYQALYYNSSIPKEINEKDKDYVKRVAQIKDTIAEEVKKAKQLHNNPNFKTNCLLSKPFLYDGMALDEIS